MRFHLPAKLAALAHKYPSAVPVVGVGAAVVAAYVGIVALRRAPSSTAPAAASPNGAVDPFAGLGLGSGLPAGPLAEPAVSALSPGGGGFDPITPVLSALAAAAPASARAADIGGSRGGVTTTGVGAPPSSHLTTVPGTPTPVGSYGGWGSAATQAAKAHPPSRTSTAAVAALGGSATLGGQVAALPFVQADPSRFASMFYGGMTVSPASRVAANATSDTADKQNVRAARAASGAVAAPSYSVHKALPAPVVARTPVAGRVGGR